ncbi:MAG: hypothetical protein ABJI96_22095 [Paracoccaceae bacterium]
MFASFVLLDDDIGRAALANYFERHIDVAKTHKLGFILESPTWRASPDWGRKLGRSREEIDKLNAEAIYLIRTLRNRHESEVLPLVISGCIGPRGNGHVPGELMNAGKSQEYHSRQTNALAEARLEPT